MVKNFKIVTLETYELEKRNVQKLIELMAFLACQVRVWKIGKYLMRFILTGPSQVNGCQPRPWWEEIWLISFGENWVSKSSKNNTLFLILACKGDRTRVFLRIFLKLLFGSCGAKIAKKSDAKVGKIENSPFTINFLWMIYEYIRIFLKFLAFFKLQSTRREEHSEI